MTTKHLMMGEGSRFHPRAFDLLMNFIMDHTVPAKVVGNELTIGPVKFNLYSGALQLNGAYTGLRLTWFQRRKMRRAFELRASLQLVHEVRHTLKGE